MVFTAFLKNSSKRRQLRSKKPPCLGPDVTNPSKNDTDLLRERPSCSTGAINKVMTPPGWTACNEPTNHRQSFIKTSQPKYGPRRRARQLGGSKGIVTPQLPPQMDALRAEISSRAVFTHHVRHCSFPPPLLAPSTKLHMRPHLLRAIRHPS